MLYIYDIIDQEKNMINNINLLKSKIENKRALDIETIKILRNKMEEFKDDKELRLDINRIVLMIEEMMKDIFI